MIDLQCTNRRMLLLATLTPHICLINNLRLDQLFNDILERDEPNGLIERISLSLRVNTMHKGHVAFYAWKNQTYHTAAEFS